VWCVVCGVWCACACACACVCGVWCVVCGVRVCVRVRVRVRVRVLPAGKSCYSGDQRYMPVQYFYALKIIAL